jgi:glycosyltransferase involved in cell wall biosynthesis
MTASMRVLHVISSMSQLRGGPTVAMHNMLKALRRKGISADVITTDDDGDTARLDVALDRFVDVQGERVRYFPRQTLKYAFSAPLLPWLLRNVRAYDLVHTHGLFSFAPLAAAWCARAAGVPYIMRPAGVLDTWGMKNKSRIVKSTSVRLLESPLLQAAAAVHFTTPLEQARAADLSLPIRPVVLPTGVEVDGSSDHGEPVEGLSAPDTRVILFLARIHPIKRVDTLLRAFAALEDRSGTLRLVIAGDGDPALVTGLQRLAQELQLGDRVRWLGFASGARKRWLLSRADVFVLPSASENFGIAVVEAMNAGAPVIVTTGCGLADFVEQHKAGVVTDDTAESLQAALARILSDEALRLGMGQSGQRAARQELSLEAFGTRLESLYRAVLADRPRRAGASLPVLKS